MRVLITGVTGFVGSHLAEYCLDQGHEVAGTFRWRSRDENLSIVKGKVALHDADLRDPVGVRKVIQAFQPERIFHLAAQSYVHASWASPAETLSTNIISQVNLFEAVREAELTECRIQIAGSSEEYGMVYSDETPIKENNPLRPLSPYGVSKVAQDLMGYQYHQSYGMFIVRTRSFNHTGPRRGDVFAESNFAKQIAEIEKGLREPVISHGNLDAYRDYTDVRDIIRAYVLSLEKCEPGEVYNIGTGNAWRIGDMLDTLIDMATVAVTKQVDPERARPSDVMRLEADSTRFRKATGWEPRIPFETTLKDLLDYWRERV
ncbi:MAG TPA: GDP-mannose 4,6-dehydratase [Actinomycetota bacterium]